MLKFPLSQCNPLLLVRNLVFTTKTELTISCHIIADLLRIQKIQQFWNCMRKSSSSHDTCAKFTACYNLIQCSIFCKFGSERVSAGCWEWPRKGHQRRYIFLISAWRARYVLHSLLWGIQTHFAGLQGCLLRQRGGHKSPVKGKRSPLRDMVCRCLNGA